MKINKLFSLIGLATLGLTSVASAATLSVAQGDLILSFATSVSPGDTSNLEVKLGSFSSYQTLFNNNSVSVLVADLGADLTATYGTGAAWNTRSDVSWSFVGSFSSGANRTVYISKIEDTAGTQSTASYDTAVTQSNLSTAISTSIGVMVNGLNGQTSTANLTTAAVLATSNGASYTTAGGAGSSLLYGDVFDEAVTANNTTVSGSNYVVSDLYKLVNGSSSMTYVGSFGLASDGKLYYSSTASSFAPIPEPSTYAAIFGVAMLGFAAYRRRFQKKA